MSAIRDKCYNRRSQSKCTAKYGSILAPHYPFSPHYCRFNRRKCSDLSCTDNPGSSARLGQTISLNVTVTPATATGKVTFYDGVLTLGVQSLSNGTAILTTDELAAGVHSLKAYYTGDGNNSAASSASVPFTVAASPQEGFNPPVTYTAL